LPESVVDGIGVAGKWMVEIGVAEKWRAKIGQKKSGLFHQAAFCVRDVRVILQSTNIHHLSEKRFHKFCKKGNI